MVKVLINKSKDTYNKVIVSGHANSNKNPNEFDLVCAGVSAVTVGILNSLEINYLDVEMKEGYVGIEVIEYNDKNNNTLEILETSLKTIEDTYGKYISIKKENK